MGVVALENGAQDPPVGLGAHSGVRTDEGGCAGDGASTCAQRSPPTWATPAAPPLLRPSSCRRPAFTRTYQFVQEVALRTLTKSKRQPSKPMWERSQLSQSTRPSRTAGLVWSRSGGRCGRGAQGVRRSGCTQAWRYASSQGSGSRSHSPTDTHHAASQALLRPLPTHPVPARSPLRCRARPGPGRTGRCW